MEAIKREMTTSQVKQDGNISYSIRHCCRANLLVNIGDVQNLLKQQSKWKSGCHEMEVNHLGDSTLRASNSDIKKTEVMGGYLQLNSPPT